MNIEDGSALFLSNSEGRDPMRQEQVGTLFFDGDGSIHRLESFCPRPSATMENIVSGDKKGGAVGCMNLSGFTPLSAASREMLIEICTELVATIERMKRDTRLASQKYLDLSVRYCSLADELANKIMEAR